MKKQKLQVSFSACSARIFHPFPALCPRGLTCVDHICGTPLILFPVGFVSGEQEQEVREKEEGEANCVPNSASAGGPFLGTVLPPTQG